jgi:hypothetical protein
MESQGKSIMLFYAYGIHNRAVWNAMQLHARILIQAGEEITFIVHSDNIELVQQQFPTHTAYSFKSILELFKIILRSNQYKIFVPDLFAVLTISSVKFFKKTIPYYWIQGAVPEESFMRHKSKLRKLILSTLENLAIRLSTFQILVSSEMQRFLQTKHRLQLHAIIVPCTSDLNYQNIPKIPNSYTYVGGMSAWQRFDTIVQMFNILAQIKPDATLHIATGDIQTAQKIIQTYLNPQLRDRITLQSINNRATMENFLNTMQYGFLIREDDPVNNVSSPIKLAEYLSCGVNVIISSSVTSYAPLVESYGAGISVDLIDDIDKLSTFTPSPRHAMQLYQDHFSESLLVKKYKSIL